MKAFAKTSDSQINLIEVPLPIIAENDLLIEIKAVGVGVHDEYFLPPNINYPYVIGIEAAGIIEKIGQSVTNYKIGDKIAFVSAMQPKGGTWAERAVVADNSLILPMPERISFEQAATLPVAGNTILKALQATDLKPGDSLFIAGGSGAIGTLAIQIAKARGYKVAASASSKNHDYMVSLGADLTVNYHDDDWQEQVKQWSGNSAGVDASIAIQPGTATDCQPAVKNGGVIVPISGDKFEPQPGITVNPIPHMADVKDELAELINQVANGQVKQPIEKVYDFSDGLAALASVKTRHTRGKLVLSLT